jgi:hypothetical protein
MSKYRPLSDRLAQETAEEWRPTFAEIEEVLGFPLPKAAQQAAWWSGGEKPHHKAWTAHGWEVGGVDKGSGVHFRRAPVGLNAGEMEPTASEAGEPASRVQVQRTVGGVALIGGAVALLAGVGVLGAKLFGKRRA